MFLHLGSNVAVSLKDIIFIGNIKLASTSKGNNDFLSLAGEEGILKDISNGNVKSFIITTNKVYLSSVSEGTLYSRISNS